MNKYPIEVGAVVVSKMGRDEGRSFVVVEREDGDFVKISDGRLRKMDHLKRKRVKHLRTTGIVIEEVQKRLGEGAAIEDHEVRSWLKREDM